jgi:hypothetical protein
MYPNHNITIVFEKKKGTGRKFFNSLIDNIKFKDVEYFRDDMLVYMCLKDGTEYKLVIANETSRGHRCTDVYIQNGIEKNIIDCVILPTCYPHKNSSDPSITYFD